MARTVSGFLLDGGAQVTNPNGFDAGFDTRWKLHPRPQATTEKMFWLKTGWAPEQLDGKLVLDAGCGCGRFSAIAARHGATVIGVDASPHAIKAARENVPEGMFVQCNLLDLKEIADSSVDMAFSIGVLHHTESTERAFYQLARKVKPGGKLVVWLYAQPCATNLLPASRMLHEITKACPPDALHGIFARWATKVRDSYGQEYGPLQSILQVSQSQDDDECISDTFDWHTPQYRYWHTYPEVRSWFRGAGYDDIYELPFPVTVGGTRA